MADTYWFKQTGELPLFPDLEWSRPENKNFAGKLLIVGGEAHSFSEPAEAYGFAITAGIGQVRIALPEQTKKLVPEAMQTMIEFLPGSNNGSFTKLALAELCEHAEWADTVLLAGGLGRNSETVALIERFSHAYAGRLVVSGDSVQSFLQEPAAILERPKTMLVTTLSELQKLAAAKQILITHTQNISVLVQKLDELSQLCQAIIVTCQKDIIISAYQGMVSTTPGFGHIWRNKSAATAAVWWTQFPVQQFEAVTSGIYHSLQIN